MIYVFFWENSCRTWRFFAFNFILNADFLTRSHEHEEELNLRRTSVKVTGIKSQSFLYFKVTPELNHENRSERFVPDFESI